MFNKGLIELKNFLILILFGLCIILGYQRYVGKDVCPLPASFSAQTNNGIAVYPGNPNQISANEVMLYTTSWCQNCKNAKAFFENRGIKYTNYDIEKSKEGQERHEVLAKPFRKAGQVGVPLIVVNGTVMYGFNENQLLAALK